MAPRIWADPCRPWSTYIMSTLVHMMAIARPDRALTERLERLTGEDASCCVPQYSELAAEIRRSAAFRSALSDAKALSDEHRLLAVALLRRRKELCACEIQAATGLTHATVSHHMSVLVEAGLVLARREGKWMHYRLSGEGESSIP